MKLRKLSLVGFIFGVLAILVSVGYPLVAALTALDKDSIGIIGGADGPTAIMITNILFSNWPGILISLGIPLVLISLFCLVFPRFVRKNFSLKTTAIALALSATGCLGLYCFITFVTIVSFDGLAGKSPISYPASFIVGVLALVLFITLFALYCKARKDCPRIVGIVLDVFTGAVFIPFFFLVEIEIIGIVRYIFHLFA